jgi:hypothetical protein
VILQATLTPNSRGVCGVLVRVATEKRAKAKLEPQLGSPRVARHNDAGDRQGRDGQEQQKQPEHHQIVAHEVTNIGSDRSQLTSMGDKAQEAMGCDELTVLADRGYFNGDQVLACEGTGVLPIIPKTQTSNNPNRGLFSGADFIYDVEHDHYTCPAGQHLTKGKVRSDRRDDMDHYRNLSACEASIRSASEAEPGLTEGPRSTLGPAVEPPSAAAIARSLRSSNPARSSRSRRGASSRNLRGTGSPAAGA